MMRYLAIDLGDKRTGLAVGDDATGIVSPQGVVVTGDEQERVRGILRAIEEVGADQLVVGLPLNMDGSEGPGAKKARDMAKALKQRTGLKVHLFDERLSSAAADEQMSQSGLTHKQKKMRRDALAARNILRGFLGEKKN